MLVDYAVGGGNLNYAFCITSTEGHSVFVKQAPDFIKVFAEYSSSALQERRS
jgi:5-methylthioribose kinase